MMSDLDILVEHDDSIDSQVHNYHFISLFLISYIDIDDIFYVILLYGGDSSFSTLPRKRKRVVIYKKCHCVGNIAKKCGTSSVVDILNENSLEMVSFLISPEPSKTSLHVVPNSVSTVDILSPGDDSIVRDVARDDI
jgi:hypothetical protein